jgi:hypothetical protein
VRRDQSHDEVRPTSRSRASYIKTLGLKVEFEVPDRQSVALQDGVGFTVFSSKACPTTTAADLDALRWRDRASGGVPGDLPEGERPPNGLR